MKRSALTIKVVLAITFICAAGYAAGPINFTGEFADKKFLNGQGVFQLSLEQKGKEVTIFFSAVRNDGQGAAPEADTTGHVTGNGSIEFTFQDSLKNSGTGTIAKAGDDVILSIKTTRVADSRCLQFYKQNMRLKRVNK